MHTTNVRPWITTGIAVVGASVIAVTPLSPPPAPVHVSHAYLPSVQAPAVDLRASIVDIFTLPVVRQWAANLVLDYGTYAVALGQASANLAQAIGLAPEALRLLIQQLLSLDLQGVLTTIEVALIGTVAAVGVPLLDAFITVRQRILARQSELQAAVPAAIIGIGAGFLDAIDTVLRSGITGGQQVVDALLTLDLGNIVNTFLSASRNFLGSFVEGGQAIVDGIVFAQQAIAAALAATPPPPGEPTEGMDSDSRSVDVAPNLGADRGARTMTLSIQSEVDENDSLATMNEDSAKSEADTSPLEADGLSPTTADVDSDPLLESNDADTETSETPDETEGLGLTEGQDAHESGESPTSDPAEDPDEQADAA
jgi:hypothetical protein